MPFGVKIDIYEFKRFLNSRFEKDGEDAAEAQLFFFEELGKALAASNAAAAAAAAEAPPAEAPAAEASLVPLSLHEEALNMLTSSDVMDSRQTDDFFSESTGEGQDWAFQGSPTEAYSSDFLNSVDANSTVGTAENTSANTAAVDLALNIRPGIFSASFSTDASQPFTPLETPVNPPLEVTFEVPPDEDSGFSSESSDSEGGARGGTHFGRELPDDGGQQLADSSDTSQGASSESTASLSKAMAAGEIREYSRDFGSPTEGGGGLSGDGDPLSL